MSIHLFGRHVLVHKLHVHKRQGDEQTIHTQQVKPSCVLGGGFERTLIVRTSRRCAERDEFATHRTRHQVVSRVANQRAQTLLMKLVFAHQTNDWRHARKSVHLLQTHRAFVGITGW